MDEIQDAENETDESIQKYVTETGFRKQHRILPIITLFPTRQIEYSDISENSEKTLLSLTTVDRIHLVTDVPCTSLLNSAE